MKSCLTIVSLVACSGFLQAEETFVTIQKVDGNRLLVIKQSAGANGQGRGMRGGAGGGRFAGRGRRGQAASNQSLAVTIPANAKITTATRERRTFEFRVGVELAGGLKHPIFRKMSAPLTARVVTRGNQITELNVITTVTDINQTNTDSNSGNTVIAVRPKRPPMKK